MITSLLQKKAYDAVGAALPQRNVDPDEPAQ